MAAKRITDATIVATFMDLQNGRAVSRQLGVHENTIYQVLRRFRGECLRCKAPVAPGKKNCPKCLEFDRERVRTHRKAQRRLGLCQNCDKQRSHASSRFCEEHRISDLEWRSAQAEKKRQAVRGIPGGGRPNDRQKRRALLARYGEEGVDRWTTARGHCEICDRPHTLVSVQLHHIDQNPKNNTADNFACLCFDCHQAVHKFIGAKSAQKLLAWLAKTYPRKMQD